MGPIRMNATRWLLLINLATSWYNVAVIWLMQILIYPSWTYIPTLDFGNAQGDHFWRLFLVVFPQAGLATLLSVVLLRWRPSNIPSWSLWIGVVLQAATWVLTAFLWGRWQGQLQRWDPLTSYCVKR